MKKILVAAASVLALFACSKPENVKVAPPVQEKSQYLHTLHLFLIQAAASR